MLERLSELRLKQNLSQQDVANSLGLSRQVYNNYELGKRQPSFEILQKLALFYTVSVDYLLGVSDAPEKPRKRGVKIPVLGVVQAGVPIEAIEDIIDYEEIPEDMARTGEFFGLEVRGESMEPKFSPGDVVIVRKQEDVDSGNIAIVLVNGSDATVKKIKKHQEGISLIPLNTAFETMFYSNEEILSLPVRILGKVVELRAKF